jgi:hypothetical protein
MNPSQLEFFTGPISQIQSFPDGVGGLPLSSSVVSPTIGTGPTVSIVDQTLNMTGASSTSNPSTSGWGNVSLTTTQGMTGSTQASQAGASLEALLQQAPTTAGPTGYSTYQPSSTRPSASGYSRPILPARPRSRKHERKRSKLSTEATPFDSVDYWMQFDTEEGLEDIQEDVTTSEPQTKSTQLPVHR